MKEVITVTKSWCDYPGCGGREGHPDGQETTTVEVYVNVVSRGRKPQVVTVELCADHRDQLRSMYTLMQKYDQKAS